MDNEVAELTPGPSTKRGARNRKTGGPLVPRRGGAAPKAPLRNVAFGVYYGGRGRYLYQPIMKCACTTIKTLLLELEGLPIDSNVWRRHSKRYNYFPGTAHLSQKMQRDIFAGRTQTFKFVVVRNPYTKLASAYRDKLVLKPRTVWSDQIRRSAKAFGLPLSPHITFAEFVAVASRQTVREMDIHWRPQYYQGHFDRIQFDFIGRMERMPADLIYILERIGAPRSMVARASERHNESGAGIELWESVPAQARERFLDAFAIDFDALGYSRELPQPQDLADSIL
jgi:Sulfotransferase family